MEALFFACMVFLCWGIGDVFTTFAARKLGAYSSTFYGFFIGAIFTSLYIPFTLGDLQRFTPSMIFLSLFLAIILLIGFLAYNYALQHGQAALTGTIAGSYPGLVAIFSLLFLAQGLQQGQIIALIIIFVGLLLSTVHIFHAAKNRASLYKGSGYALIALLAWALYFTFIKIPVQQAGFFWPTYIACFVALIFFAASGINKISPPEFHWKNGFPAAIISGVLLALASFSYNYGIGQGISANVAAVAGAYPVLFALLAYDIFKDPISSQQKVGIIITLCGIILHSYFSW